MKDVVTQKQTRATTEMCLQVPQKHTNDNVFKENRKNESLRE